MNKTKILPILLIGLLSLFLITEVVSAMEESEIVSAKWLPSGKYKTITDGESLDFSISIPHNDVMWGCYLRWAEVSVALYDSESGQLVYSYLNNKILTRDEINNGFFATYHLDKSEYEGIGKYYLEVYKKEGWLVCGYGDNSRSILTEKLYLTVNPEPTQVEIISQPITQVDENSEYNYPVNAGTPGNGGKFIYSLVESPSWISINSETGLVEGTAPEVEEDTNLDIELKVSEVKCFNTGASPSTGALSCNIENMISEATQSYVLKVKNIEEEPEPETDYYTCQQDSDCISVQASCCSCNYGGILTSINKAKLTEWNTKILGNCSSVACIASISNHWTCTNSKPDCVLGKCKLVLADEEPEDPVCGDGICETGENCHADCDNKNHESNYDYGDVYETTYLVEEDGRKPAETINLVEPETLKAEGFWARLWKAIAEFFRNLF